MNIDFSRAGGRWTVVPHVLFTLEAKCAGERIDAELHYLQVWLSFNEQRLGQALIPYTLLSHLGNQLEAAFSMTRDSLAYINRDIRGDSVSLRLDFNGLMRVRHHSDDFPRYEGVPARGEWVFIPIGGGRNVALDVRIPRSEWFTQVLEPIGIADFVLTEIAVPKGELRGAWTRALARIADAEQQFVLGRDPEVFFQCRAALESLPGSPLNIFDQVTSPDKRDQINDLTREFVQYLHVGRHVEQGEEISQGFGVDHRDAEFALAMTKIVVSYASKLS